MILSGFSATDGRAEAVVQARPGRDRRQGITTSNYSSSRSPAGFMGKGGRGRNQFGTGMAKNAGSSWYDHATCHRTGTAPTTIGLRGRGLRASSGCRDVETFCQCRWDPGPERGVLHPCFRKPGRGKDPGAASWTSGLPWKKHCGGIHEDFEAGRGPGCTCGVGTEPR